MKRLRATIALIFAILGTSLCILGIIVDAMESVCAHVVKQLTKS